MLSLNKHINSELQIDYNNFGVSCFSFSVLKEYNSCDNLKIDEQSFIDQYSKNNVLYNRYSSYRCLDNELSRNAFKAFLLALQCSNMTGYELIPEIYLKRL